MSLTDFNAKMNKSKIDNYLQTGYSDMLDISYLFNNNTLKCIKAKIVPFNQNLPKLVLPSGARIPPTLLYIGCAMEKTAR